MSTQNTRLVRTLASNIQTDIETRSKNTVLGSGGQKICTFQSETIPKVDRTFTIPISFYILIIPDSNKAAYIYIICHTS